MLQEEQLEKNILDDLPDDLLEIRDPEIDPEQIMSRIRERIHQRRSELGYEPGQFPSFGGIVFPGKPDDIPYDPNLYYHLETANKIYLEVDTEPLLTSSPATRIPVLGRFWTLLRFAAHQLALFYVNRAITQQTNINRHMISTLNLLTATTQEQQRAIMDLEEEVKILREKLEAVLETGAD